MAKQNENLFEESSRGAVSAITALVVVVSFVLAFGGMVLGGYAFTSGMEDLQAAILFSASLAITAIGFALPFNILPAIGK